jgi:hypothetical protein
MNKSILTVAFIGLLGLATTGCQTATGNSALAGGATGALIGAGIGSLSHQRAGEGALVGGAIGAISGAIIGNEIDKQQQYGSAPPPATGPAPVAAPYSETAYGYGPPPPPVYVYPRPYYYGPRVTYEVHYRTHSHYPRGRYYTSYRCN